MKSTFFLFTFIFGALFSSCHRFLEWEDIDREQASILIVNTEPRALIVGLDSNPTKGDYGQANDERLELPQGGSKVWKFDIPEGTDREFWIKRPGYPATKVRLQTGEHKVYMANKDTSFAKATFINQTEDPQEVNVSPGKQVLAGFVDENHQDFDRNPRTITVPANSQYDLYLGFKSDYYSDFTFDSKNFGNKNNTDYPTLGYGELTQRTISIQGGIEQNSPYIFYSKNTCTVNINVVNANVYFKTGGTSTLIDLTGRTILPVASFFSDSPQTYFFRIESRPPDPQPPPPTQVQCALGNYSKNYQYTKLDNIVEL